MTSSSLISLEDHDNRSVCKEIRHNSTGCLRMKDQCEKCREILSVGESGSLGSLLPQWGCLDGVRQKGVQIPALLPSSHGTGRGPLPRFAWAPYL